MAYHIFHSVKKWLSPTSPWIADQIRLFPLEQQTVLTNVKVNPPTDISANLFQKSVMIRSTEAFRRRAIRKQRADVNIVFSHFGNQAWHDLALNADLKIGRFYGYDLHRLPTSQPIWNERYLELFDKIDVLLCEGPYMKQILMDKGANSNKIKVLPLGVKPFENPQIRTTNGHLNILIAGTFTPKKGIHTALDACLLLAENEAGFSFSIDIIGDYLDAVASPDAYKSSLEVKLNHPLLKSKITRHGYVSRERLHRLALQSHCALLPSEWTASRDCEGGFPVIFLDLMATGLPIISTDHCDIPFAITSENGFLAQEKDVEQLAKYILQISDNDVLMTKSKAAIATVEQRFLWDKLAPLYHQTILKR